MRKLAIYCIGLLSLFGTAPMMATDVVSLQVEGYPEVPFEDFDEAWTAAMSVTDVTIKLLADIERTKSIVYRPTVDNARHTLDLNNHTITENTTTSLLYISKADAKLTVIDSSTDGNGCLYKKMASLDNISSVSVSQGEFEIASGNIYCESTQDDEGTEDARHAAIGISNHLGNTAKVTVSGGKIEATAYSVAYGIIGYAPVQVSDGIVRATVTKFNGARALMQLVGEADITGGTFEARAINSAISAYAVSVTGWIGETKDEVQNSVAHISGGTFKVETATNNAVCARADGTVKEINGEIVTAHGSMFISGGDFSAYAPNPSATQVFAAVANGTRLFDNATPHHLKAESKGDITISGGNFLVDTRDADGHYVDNGDNIDLLRCWGTLNVSGGTFTIYQHNNAVGVGVYRNKATISGNPIFHIHCASNARGIIANQWNHAGYCDADAANNMAEVDVSGGTFVVQCDSAVGNSIALWAYGGISSASASGDAGYAMNTKITVTDGDFTVIHPLSSGARAIRQEKERTGEYGTAVAQVIIQDGKFKSLTGTEAQHTPTGQNIDNQDDLNSLTGGYFANYNQLALHVAYDHTFRELTSDEPEYAEGYRYQVVSGPAVATVTVNNERKEFAMMQRAIQYARRQSRQSRVTLTDDALFYGPHSLVPTVNENDILLDLNGHNVSSVTATDRFFTLDKADMHFTVTDNSTAGNGVWQMTAENDNTAYGILCNRGNLKIEGGEIRVTHAGGKAAIATGTTSADANMTIAGSQITAPRALLCSAGTITVNDGRFNTPMNVSGTASGTINLLGGYYVSDGQLADYCAFPYEVRPTTEEDKERVGEMYEFKVTDEYSSYGLPLDIIDYQSDAVTVNMNGYTSDEEPPLGWEMQAFGIVYHLEDCAANRTIRVPLPEPVEAGANVRITVRSQAGTVESGRLYTMPYIFDGDATLPEGDYSASTIYVRSGVLTIDSEVTVAKVIVCAGAEVKVTDGLLTADTIVLRGTPFETASVSGSIEAAKTFFTRIGPDGSEKYPANRYYPLTLPEGYCSPLIDVRLSNGTTPAYGVSWGVKKPVGEVEQMLTINDVLDTGVEYELFSSRHYYREYYFPLSPSTTDIPLLTDSNAKARKVLVNGQLLIVTGDGVYDAMGRSVVSHQPSAISIQ